MDREPRPDFIVLQDVHKTYRVGEQEIRAVDGVDFTVGRGEFAIVAGASGAGKTTVLNLIGGMDHVTSGCLSVDDRVVSGLDARRLTEYRRNDIGFVFQYYNLVPNLTALENVELATEIRREHLDPKTTLEQVGLGDRLQNFPAQLSGGEQQRVAIARALAKNPKLLLCDEPTGALDYQTGKQILTLLQDTCRRTGTTVVVITHNLAIAPMADRVIRMKSGRAESVTENPAAKSVQEIEW